MGIPFVEWTCAICIGELMGIQWDINQEYHPVNLPGASKYWIFELQTQKRSILGVGLEKEHQSGFCRSWHFGRSGVEKSVQKAFKKRSKPFGSVLELKKAFWSGNNRSGVLFLLNLAKLIDFGFGVEISTIKRIQVHKTMEHHHFIVG